MSDIKGKRIHTKMIPQFPFYQTFAYPNHISSLCKFFLFILFKFQIFRVFFPQFIVSCGKLFQILLLIKKTVILTECEILIQLINLEYFLWSLYEIKRMTLHLNNQILDKLILLNYHIKFFRTSVYRFFQHCKKLT